MLLGAAWDGLGAHASLRADFSAVNDTATSNSPFPLVVWAVAVLDRSLTLRESAVYFDCLNIHVEFLD